MQFRMCGLKVELCRWQVDYTEQIGEDTVNMTVYVPTGEEADFYVNQYKGKKSPLSTDGYDWIDGIIVPETTKPKNEAERLIALGKEGYKNYIEQGKRSTSEQLRADVDFLMLLGGAV